MCRQSLTLTEAGLRIQVHGPQCLRCTYSTAKGVSASKSRCTAVKTPSRFTILGRNPGTALPDVTTWQIVRRLLALKLRPKHLHHVLHLTAVMVRNSRAQGMSCPC
jgi:hypothetical protein